MFGLAICALALVGMAAQAAGVPVQSFLTAHADILVALTGMAFIGDTTIITPDEMRTSLAKLSDQVKEIGEKAMGEVKKAGDMSSKTKETADELLLKQGELQTRLQALEQKADKQATQIIAQLGHTPGNEVINSEAFKQYIKAGDFRKGFSMPVKAIVSITSDPASAGQNIAPDRQAGLVVTPDRRMTVRDLLTPGRTASNLIQYVRETGFQNMAATVLEGAAKPKSDITFDLVATSVVKIATYVKASTEILQDAPMMQSYVDGRLRYMLSYVEEAQLLKGSGVGNNLNGIYTQATAYVAPFVVTGATRIDVLRLAMLQAELALYPSTGIVLHPADWTAIELTKDTTGNYIFANPQSLAQPALWGRPVVSTQAMTQDEFLVGAFKLGAQIFDRQQSNVVVATENEDDFIKNMVTILRLF